MEQYPSIEGSSKAPLGKPCIAFYKYDGSNLRWEWNPKKGWFKFGTRHELFDQSNWEGVVAKGEGFMVKVKTDAYLKQLKEVFVCGGWKKYWE
jgi:hypothetical protein